MGELNSKYASMKSTKGKIALEVTNQKEIYVAENTTDVHRPSNILNFDNFDLTDDASNTVSDIEYGNKDKTAPMKAHESKA